MLTEDSVVLIVCDWLVSQGWVIQSRCLGTSKGDDIVAFDQSKAVIRVECKGSLSPRTGIEFTSNDCWQRASGAVFNYLRESEMQDWGDMLAIALPRTQHYQNLIEPLKGLLSRNHLAVIWVEPGGVVDVWSNDRIGCKLGACTA